MTTFTDSTGKEFKVADEKIALLINSLIYVREQYTDTLAAFNERMAKNPMAALEHYNETLIRATVQMNVHNRIIDDIAFGLEIDPELSIDTVLKQITTDVSRKVADMAAHPRASTSQTANYMHSQELAVYAELLKRSSRGW